VEADSIIVANRGNPDFVILDIRLQHEYDYARIADAVSFDLMTGTFPRKLDRLEKQKTYLLYCNADDRSPEALDLMERKGFAAAYRIGGGLIAWVEAGFPIERGDAARTP
jgi:rhodanese-related sulfurtransferase